MPSGVIDKRWLLGGLLFLFSFQVVAAMRQSSPTADEYAHHIANGFSYVATGDFRMNPATPPLPRMMAGFPLKLLGYKGPFEHPSWQAGDSPQFAKQFFEVVNSDIDTMVFWARVPNLFLSLFFALAVFAWATKLFGDIGGLTAVALYAFCPDIVAHSGLATADIAIAFFFFLSIRAFWKYLHAPSGGRAFKVGLFTGLAFLSKFSALLLLPAFLSIAIASGTFFRMRLRHFFVFVPVCLVTIWSGYFFEMKPLLKNTPDPAKKEAVYRQVGGEKLVRFANEVPVPLSTFSSSLASMLVTRARGTNAFLFGEWSTKGWWYYYFAAFAMKNTLPLLILFLLSVLSVRHLGLDRLALTAIVTPIALFFLATLNDKAQAGIRYFLPIYPFVFLLCGGAVAYFWKQRPALKKVALALVAWHAVEAAVICPHPMAYFNELAGGPSNGYKNLRDSNLDWGQDLKGLAAYVKEKKYDEIVLGYHWPAPPDYYQFPYRRFRDEEMEVPGNEVYAIAVHILDNVRWAKDVKPDAQIGYSIFIYDMRKKNGT